MSQVNVIVPCYKYAHFLRGCVESVLSQEGVDVRVLIIDDASPDNTAEVAAGLAAADGRVEFRRHATNQGHIATYNEGLRWADGEYTLLLSADDLLTPGALARAAGVMDAHPEVGLAYGRQIILRDGRPEPPVQAPGCGARLQEGLDFIRATCACVDNLVPTPTAVVRTRLQHEIGGYRKELPHAADMDMWLRFATRGSVAELDTYQAFYRVHGKNMHVEVYGTRLADLGQRRLVFQILFEESRNSIPGWEGLHAEANTNLAWEAFWIASRAFDRGDVVAFREARALALELGPSLRATAEWRRARWKWRLGPQVWSLLRPLAGRLRGRRPHVVGG